MTDSFSVKRETIPSRKGLDTLRVSASGQPAEPALSSLYRRIRNAAGDGADIWLVDLRQESHGFINGKYAVSWYKDRNWANKGMPPAMAERDELGRLAALIGSRTTFEPMGNYDTAHLEAVTEDVRTAVPEREPAVRAGFKYLRIPATDQAAPNDAAIDEFVTFAAALPKDAWLHLHCHAGHGRTTTFLVFFDIMKNPEVPLEEIVARQHALGGTDLFNTEDEVRWRAREKTKRADTVRAFYEYAKVARADGFRTLWSQWKKSRMTY